MTNTRMIHLRDGNSEYRACGDTKAEPQFLVTDIKLVTCPRCMAMIARMMRRR